MRKDVEAALRLRALPPPGLVITELRSIVRAYHAGSIGYKIDATNASHYPQPCPLF